MFRACAGLLSLLMLAAEPLAAADSTLFLGQIRVEDARAAASGSSILRYRIMHENAALVGTRLGRWIDRPQPIEGGIAFTLSAYPVTSTPAAQERHRTASFLIDYTEPAVQALAGPIEQRYGKQPTPGDLEQFVYDYIVDKNVAHGFDVASMAAKSRAGDCTEHAVLLTALLRMYGYPARTVTGFYVSLDEPVVAYGHAWTEYYSASGWLGLDGTRIGQTVGAQHVPMDVVEDETIGYAIGLISGLQMLAIERVIVE